MDEIRSSASGKIVGDRTECLSKIIRNVEVRSEIVFTVIVERDVHSRCIKVRWLDATHPRLFWHTRKPRRDVGPLAAVICSEPHVAVVCTNPKNPRPDRRLGRGRDRAVRLRTGVIARNASSELGAHDDAGRIPGRKIRRDRVEMVATVGGLQ